MNYFKVLDRLFASLKRLKLQFLFGFQSHFYRKTYNITWFHGRYRNIYQMSTVYTNPRPAFTFLEESWTPPRGLGINSRFFAPGLKRLCLTESEGYHVIECSTVEGFTKTSHGFGIDHSVPGGTQCVITGELSTRSVAPAPRWRLDVWERSIYLCLIKLGLWVYHMGNAAGSTKA